MAAQREETAVKVLFEIGLHAFGVAGDFLVRNPVRVINNVQLMRNRTQIRLDNAVDFFKALALQGGGGGVGIRL
jgi:hypothetical protein